MGDEHPERVSYSRGEARFAPWPVNGRGAIGTLIATETLGAGARRRFKEGP